MTDPCGGPLNLLKNQYDSWWTSVFLTITSECANIPAFSYLGSSGFHRFILPKSSLSVARTIFRRLPNWNKSRLINGLTSTLKRCPFFTYCLTPGEGRSCGPATASRDRQFFRSGPDRASSVRKTLGLTAEFRLPQESVGVDGPLNGPGGPGTACLVTGDSWSFPAINGDIRLSNTLRPIQMDQCIRRKAARAI
ncbi:hypothetical protein [Ketogulonicigenium vulgare]|uniref:hypothetical protein n=1 Tax=Ketogulonicigenium vulgare TaxID=92945 RepID=UPI0011D14A75|nr:hypothetical protein [Ketogulonicigenium vulgare]